MRDAVGGAWVYGIVMVFTLLFAAFLALALTYARAYRMKNEMTSIIEKYQGITVTDALSGMGSVSIINHYLANNGYNAKGVCPVGTYGTKSLTSTSLTPSNGKSRFYYCIGFEKNNPIGHCTYIFKVRVFYDFNLPILGQIRRFSVNGQTNELNLAYFNGTELPSC